MPRPMMTHLVLTKHTLEVMEGNNQKTDVPPEYLVNRLNSWTKIMIITIRSSANYTAHSEHGATS